MSGRSNCQTCNDSISKGAFRVATTFFNPRAGRECRSNWSHLRCDDGQCAFRIETVADEATRGEDRPAPWPGVCKGCRKSFGSVSCRFHVGPLTISSDERVFKPPIFCWDCVQEAWLESGLETDSSTRGLDYQTFGEERPGWPYQCWVGEYSSDSGARNRSRGPTVRSIDLSGPTRQVFTIRGHPLSPVNGEYYQAGLYNNQPYFASADHATDQGTRLYVHYCATRQCWRITLSFNPEADTANSWMHSSRPMLPIGNTTWQVRYCTVASPPLGTLWSLSSFARLRCIDDYRRRR